MSNPTGGPPDDVDAGVAGELQEDRHVGGRDLTRWESPVGRWLAGIVHRISLALGSKQTLVLILAIGAAITATMTWLASEVYEAVVAANGVARLDQPLLETMMGWRSPWLDTFATAYTDIGGVIGMPILATTIMVVLAIRRRSWTPVILITAAGVGALLMTIAGKQLIGRTRPPLADAVPPYEYSPSFPSGHTLNALVIAGIVAYLLVLRPRPRRRARRTPAGAAPVPLTPRPTHKGGVCAGSAAYLGARPPGPRRGRVLTVAGAALFAFTIGVSRVFLGHHWFTDVLAAWMLGAAWLTMVITAHRLYLTETRRTTTGRVEDTREGRPRGAD